MQLQWRARGCTGQLTTCLECTWCQFQHLCVLILNCALALAYTYLLLLISMLWHRQAILKSKGDKLCSSAECRIWTRGPRHTYIHICWFNFDALAQGNAYKPTKEPINYRGPGGDRTHDLQTEATPPAASCPARTLHATEIAHKNSTPMTCPWLHWTTDNLSGMHMVSISTPVCVNFELRPGAGDIHICWFNFDALAQGNAYKPTKEPINYRGPGGDRTHDLQTEATPPAASCPVLTLHATEIAPKNATPMTCPWLHWTTDNLSGMHMVSISTPVCVNFELRPGAGNIPYLLV